jgi:hypothetical protein
MQIASPKIAFSNNELTELEWVFASVCEALEAKQGKQNEEEKGCIRRRLFLMACNGMSDPRSLRDHLVRSFTKSKVVLGARVPIT